MRMKPKLGPRTATGVPDRTHIPAALQTAPQIGLKVWSTADGCPDPIVWDLCLCEDWNQTSGLVLKLRGEI